MPGCVVRKISLTACRGAGDLDGHAVGVEPGYASCPSPSRPSGGTMGTMSFSRKLPAREWCRCARRGRYAGNRHRRGCWPGARRRHCRRASLQIGRRKTGPPADRGRRWLAALRASCSVIGSVTPVPSRLEGVCPVSVARCGESDVTCRGPGRRRCVQAAQQGDVEQEVAKVLVLDDGAVQPQ